MDRNAQPQQRAWLLLTAALFLLYYFPLAFPGTAVVTAHDNMEAEVVLNRIVATWLRDPGLGRQLALAGHVPIWANPRLTQPLSYLYLLPDPWHAYVLNDLVVRIAAFAGAWLLARRCQVSCGLAVLAAACFSFSLSYTAFGLSIAGMPLVLWAMASAHELKSPARWLCGLAVVFVGWNSSLALGGIFFLVMAVPLLSRGLGMRVSRAWLWPVGLYSAGLVLGNLGLLYAQLGSGVVWQRAEYRTMFEPGSDNLHLFTQALQSVLWPTLDYPWYHVAIPLLFLLYGGALIAVLEPQLRRRAGWLAGAFVVIVLLFSAVQMPAVAALRERAGGLVQSFQFDRFYWLSSLLALCMCIVAAGARRERRRLFVVAVVLQLVFVFVQTPHWGKAIRTASGLPADPRARSFESYYGREWFDAARPMLAGGVVLTVGLDPMTAPMNGVPSLDGYYPLYPLAYKHEFRRVIERSLPESGMQDYFDSWGNRVYAFHAPGRAFQINFCEAQALGATHVIAAMPLDARELVPVAVPEPGPLLYQIRCR